MARVFSMASGSLWRWTQSKNLNALMPCLRELDISGVELTFGSGENLSALRLSEAHKAWLRGLAWVTLHAPFHLLSESADRAGLRRQLRCIRRLCQGLGAKNVIIHPDNLPPPELLEGLPVSTENLPLRGYRSVAGMERVLSAYPRMGFCLDVSHAYLTSRRQTGRFVEAFRERITQVHLSGTYRGRDHLSLRQVKKRFLESIEPVMALDVPVVIEEDLEPTGVEFLKEEVAYVKALFLSRGSRSVTTSVQDNFLGRHRTGFG